MIWGKLPRDYRIPPSLDFSAFTIFSTNYPAYKMFMLLFAIGIFVALLLVLTRTRVGLFQQGSKAQLVLYHSLLLCQGGSP